MKFRSFYLFYLLTILLLVLGLLSKNSIIISPGWDTIIIEGYWAFFIPTAVCSLVTALIYHYWYNSGRPLPKTAFLHFIVTIFGLIFSLNIYRLIIFMLFSGTPDTSAIAYGEGSILFILLGPIFLIASLIIFIIGLYRAKRLQKDRLRERKLSDTPL